MLSRLPEVAAEWRMRTKSSSYYTPLKLECIKVRNPLSQDCTIAGQQGDKQWQSADSHGES